METVKMGKNIVFGRFKEDLMHIKLNENKFVHHI